MSKKSNPLLGLEPRTFPKNVQWAIDQDYVSQLDPEQKEFLGRFNNEAYGNYGLKEPEALHNTPELRRCCYDRNNCQNRDLYAIHGNALIREAEAAEEQNG